jgi:hypothetical protein
MPPLSAGFSIKKKRRLIMVVLKGWLRVLQRMFLAAVAMAALAAAITTRLDAADNTAILDQRVDLRGCSIALSPVTSGNVFYPVQRIDGVNVTFVNRGPVPLSVVTFQVRYNGETQTVTDRGIFSPGIRIDHRLGALQSEPYAGSEVSCEVSASRLPPEGSTRYAGD